jgi:hypothetical protein
MGFFKNLSLVTAYASLRRGKPRVLRDRWAIRLKP